MNFLYNNFQVSEEKCYIKNYQDFKEIILCKNVLKKDFEPLIKKKSTKFEKDRICSSRIKSKIRDYVLMNDFEYFYTQTMNSNFDRYDLNTFKNEILKRFKAYKRKNKDFIYLIIFEKHKNGAYHLHGLLGGLGVDLVKNINGYETLLFFNDIGFNSISKIKNKNKVSNYILKYISKDISKTDSGCSYFHSKGLKLPLKEEIYIDNFDNLDLFFENDYIKKFRLKEKNNG